MDTHDGRPADPSAAAPSASRDPAEADPGSAGEDHELSWWHRDHPVFAALSGFFTGLVTVIVVPGAFAAILNVVFAYDRAEDIFPLVLLIFVVPGVLIAVPRTRRFGRYMLLGMLLTAVVVVGVAALVLWVLYSRDS